MGTALALNRPDSTGKSILRSSGQIVSPFLRAARPSASLMVFMYACSGDVVRVSVAVSLLSCRIVADVRRTCRSCSALDTAATMPSASTETSATRDGSYWRNSALAYSPLP